MTLYKASATLLRSHCTRDYVRQVTKRPITLAVPLSQQTQLVQQFIDAEAPSRQDDEWLHAKEFSSLPGPSRLGLIMNFLPGGKYHNVNLINLNKLLREEYGDIHLIKGTFGKLNMVATYNINDIELVYRNEGSWPLRFGLDSFHYYRIKKRPEVFKGIGGLVSEQGKGWADIRNKVNPILMKLQNVRQYVPAIDQIATEFIDKLESLRDTKTGQLKKDFLDELKMWALESISFIALNTRMGLLTDNPDPNGHELDKHMTDFFQYSFEFDVVPSYWIYVETPGFKRLLNTYDRITDITTNYIDKAMEKFEAEGNEEAKSVLEKLCRLDKQVAVVMAMDMLMAGIDTTSSAFTTALYHIAKNPEKQALLRKELKSVMPDKRMALTEENTKNLPYLRACIKEALRITSITPSNFRVAVKDLVLSGYKVPRGTGILMGVLALANSEECFPRSVEFLPERWLKSGEMACPAAKQRNPFAYLPFGFGARTCIGKRIAEMEIETLLARLIRNYNVTWQSDKELKYISNIILMPHGDISFKFEPISD